ncbi:MAG: hypothetical protein HKN17_09060 [Rhodothermales bacterium]|nr:hypothetical protein [Rhodothermales bacterium]
MLRVLLIILAVVSITLALALDLPILYLVAVLLLLGAGALFTLEMRRRHDDVPEKFDPIAAPEEDLDSLGILEIRPRERSAASDTESDGGAEGAPAEGSKPEKTRDHAASGESLADDEEPLPKPRVADIAEPFGPRKSATRENSTDSILGEVREKAPRARIVVAEAASPVLKEVLVPAYKSLRAAVNAYTVCLLREEKSPLRYHVEAIVSQNSYARESGSFASKEPMLAGHKALVPVVYPRIGPGGFPKGKLGYYHEPISVRQVAVVPIVPKKSSDAYLLLVDTTNDGGLEAASVRVLLEQYARLTTTILESDAEGGLAEPDDEPRPRRDIIEEEMERARAMSHPLSLALVFLNRGEKLDDAGGDQLADAESAFENRLRDVVIDARVERFGELTYGVFYHGASDGVAAWAAGLQASFENENGVLEGGVSVGVVLMTDRHDGPDDLRSDATAALQESFETGECTIVG